MGRRRRSFNSRFKQIGFHSIKFLFLGLCEIITQSNLSFIKVYSAVFNYNHNYDYLFVAVDQAQNMNFQPFLATLKCENNVSDISDIKLIIRPDNFMKYPYLCAPILPLLEYKSLNICQLLGIMSSVNKVNMYVCIGLKLVLVFLFLCCLLLTA